MNLSIEIAITCTWFQRRLCWMLSSVLQQVGDIPDLVFSIGYPMENGDPTTEELIEFFRDRGLNIKEFPYDGMERIQFRGLARNDQLKSCRTDWILFADTDMVYHPRFFEDLGKQLEGPLKDEKKILSARRVSLHKKHCKDYFNIHDEHTYPCEVENAGTILEDWPLFQMSGNVGAGYFQLVNVAHVKENFKGIYVNEDECRDWSWSSRGQKANSDKQFRRMLGGITKIKTKPQYHLNHERDNEEGHHVTIQR